MQSILPVGRVHGGLRERAADMLRRFKVRRADTQIVECPALLLQGDSLIVQSRKNFFAKPVQPFGKLHRQIPFSY